MAVKTFPRIVLVAGSLIVMVQLAVPYCLAEHLSSASPKLLPAVAPVPRSQRHEFRHEIDHLEEIWRNAMVSHDSAALENLLSDDYTGITADGAIQTKEQAVGNLRSGALKITTLNIADRKIRIYGATSVVTSLAEISGTRNDTVMSGRYRYTRVYVRNPQGQWKIVSFEASRIQEPAERK